MSILLPKKIVFLECIFIVLILLHADHRGNIWDSQSFVCCSKMFTGFWISSSKALPFKGVFNQFKSWGLSYSWKCIKKVYTAKVKKKWPRWYCRNFSWTGLVNSGILCYLLWHKNIHKISEIHNQDCPVVGLLYFLFHYFLKELRQIPRW